MCHFLGEFGWNSGEKGHLLYSGTVRHFTVVFS